MRKNRLTESAIRAYMGETVLVGRKICCFDGIDSTNTYAKKLALEGGEDGTAVLAEFQTAGRGRMERKFQSPSGKGIYLSLLLRPQLPPERFLPVTALTGVAVCRAVERLCGVGPGLKWPNDPVLNGRKLAGVLTELVMVPGGELAVVVGVGVNVFQIKEDFSPDVAEIATSLLQEGYEISRAALTAALLEELDAMYQVLLAGDLAEYLADYRQKCVNLGRTVQLINPDGSREIARALDVDEAFGLVVRMENGETKTVRTGEVSVRGLYGYIE